MKIWKMLTKKQRKKAVEEILSACDGKDLERLMKLDQVIKTIIPSLNYYLTGMGSNIDDPDKVIFKFNIEFDATDFADLTDEDVESLKKELESIT